jgi:2-dehydropantoate 2-reductase
MTTGFKHVAVIGPGAIGCCAAVRLALAPGGPGVTLIDHRPDRAVRLSAQPILIHTPGGDLEAAIPVRIAPDSPPDLVLLATKAYAARAAAATAAAWIGRAPIVCMQNGLGVSQEVAAALSQTSVITAVSYQGANFVREGEVNQVAILQTHLGYEGRGPDETAQVVADLLDRAGLAPRLEADMTPLVWGKLIVNAAINPVAALAGVTNSEVAARPALRALAGAIAEEGEATARACGVVLPYAGATEAMLETARGTAGNRCSMLQDLEAGRPTEIDYLNGAIASVAEACGAAASANRAIAAIIRRVSAANKA